MRNIRRVAGLLAALCLAMPLLAQAAWPDRPVRLVWPFAAGGIGSNLARVLADGLSQRLGQTVYVDAKPGAGGVVAFQYVANAAPDGYTLLLGTNSTLTLSPSLYKNLPFDTVRDFEHIAMCFTGGNVVVVKADGPIKSFADLRAQARAKHDALTYGSAGNASTFHLTPAMFDMLNGSHMVHVPYKGGNPAFMSLLAGETSVVFGSTESLPHIRAGKMRALAVMSRKRLEVLPEVPTTAELGMPDLVMESFYGLMAPAKTPRDILERLNRETAVVLASPAVQQQLRTLAIEAAHDTSPGYFLAQVKSETARWKPVIDSAGITGE